MKPVTIRDIARLLNLSITTVSRALDGYPDVSNRTRLRVLETADELGYVPNQAARQLRRHKTDVIGFVLPSAQPKFSDPFYSEFLTGLGDEAATHGMDLLISIAPPDTEDEKNIYKRWARSQKVDGIILNHIRAQDWRIRFLRDEALPFVSLEHNQDNAELPYIEVTNQVSMQEIVTHLAKNGYKNIAYIGGFENYVVQQSRMQGFLDGLLAHGLAIHNNFIHLGDFTSASGIFHHPQNSGTKSPSRCDCLYQ